MDCYLEIVPHSPLKKRSLVARVGIKIYYDPFLDYIIYSSLRLGKSNSVCLPHIYVAS